MRVTILGSGTAVPRGPWGEERFPAGYLVQTDAGTIVVDLGPGIVRRIGQVGLDLDSIDDVLLTHYHTDHCADVAALLFGLRNPRYAGRSRLRIWGSAGLRELLDHLRAAWPWASAKGYELELKEIGAERFTVAGLAVETFRIEHTDASLGYRLESADGSICAFSGDATYCDALVPLAKDADLFICDSAFPTAAPDVGHMTATEAGRAAAAAGVRTLCLTHFYPECEGHDLAAEARAAGFAGEVVLARDFATFDLAAAAGP